MPLKVNFTLQSRLNLDKRYSTLFQSVRGVIGSCLYYLVKLPKKLNLDLCQFFLTERKHCSN